MNEDLLAINATRKLKDIREELADAQLVYV